MLVDWVSRTITSAVVAERIIEERLDYYLYYCTALSDLRAEFLGTPSLQALLDLSETPIKKNPGFHSYGWLVVIRRTHISLEYHNGFIL